MLYAIQGLYWEEVLGHNYGVALLSRAFSGFITDKGGVWIGSMEDLHGQSMLSEVIISDTEVRFCKKYDGSNDLIKYEFHLQDKIWIGRYWLGEHSENGNAAKCVITRLSDDFLDHPVALSEYI